MSTKVQNLRSAYILSLNRLKLHEQRLNWMKQKLQSTKENYGTYVFINLHHSAGTEVSSLAKGRKLKFTAMLEHGGRILQYESEQILEIDVTMHLDHN